MGILERFREGLTNPLAWLLFAALAIAEYGNYRRGIELDRVCELTGPHDVMTNKPASDREELDNICGARQGEPD
jgi:hypothetical protein